MKRYIYKPVRQSYSFSIFPTSFSGSSLVYTPLHAHAKAELHLILRGEADYTVNTDTLHMLPGELLYIPKETLHSSNPCAPDTMFCAFGSTIELDGVQKVTVSPVAITEMLEAARQAELQQEPSLLSPWLMYLMNLLQPDIFCKAEERRDDIGVILSFIYENYNRDISLADVAAATDLSQRQVQRLIRQETGRTFLQQLTHQRLKVAAHLMDHSNMALEEIAVYVGYQSYSGFWKVWQKYKNEINDDTRPN